MRIATALLPLALSAVLASCSADRGAGGTASTATPDPTAAAAGTAGTVDSADVATHYDCGAGVDVALLEDGKARATIPGQPVVELQRVADSTPPVFTGANLYFTIGQDDAHLSQRNGTELACRRQ